LSDFHSLPDIKIIEEPVKINADDQGLFYLNDDGCPTMLTSITDSGEWLSDKIPNV